MKLIFSMVLLFASINSYSSVSSGQTIEANKFNNSTFQVGDIKQSLLTLTQFQSIHGNCWKLMNGDSLANTDLGLISGASNLPNLTANGEFLRQAKAGRTVGSLETDANKSHRHTANATAYNVNAAIGGIYFRNVNRISAGMDTIIGSIANYTVNENAINASGDTEARPKNLAVNMFVKVNNNCQ